MYVNETYSDIVRHFTTTNAANDVAHGIEYCKKHFGYETTYVFGYSYGTYWTNRYMQVAPNQADAVIMDGNCAPGIYSLWRYMYCFQFSIVCIFRFKIIESLDHLHQFSQCENDDVNDQDFSIIC